MPLEAGTKLGVYEIRSPLGAGGMGEVYRAADTKLGREVAIKVLPEELSRDRERLARFEREAKLLAALNHTNVATLYGLETADDQPFLVMELVEGETLAELIERGPLPADEATSLFIQIAEGLRAAHEKGVIHRDLKPANIKITPDGVVKILDFGLAKAFVGEDEPPLDTSQSPTLTRGTALGVIMGTAHYMSPEQARGKPVDKRTDIWAFGCCLFEALSGRRAFDGDDAAEILGAVIHKEPDGDALPVGGPRRLVERCLRKNQRERLQDIGDVGLVLDRHEAAPTPKRSSKPLAVALASFVGLAVGAGLGSMLGEDEDVWPEPRRFSIPLEESERIGGFITFDNPIAFSPDGSYLVYAASRGSTSALYLRDMRSGETKEVPGTTGAIDPSFSPDGQWISFFADSRFKKIRLQGGEPNVIAETGVNFPAGASWGPDGSIAFSIWREGLFMISAAAGEPEALTTEPLDALPTFLPDGRSLLVTTGGFEPQEWRLGIVDVASRERTVLDELGRASSGVYLDPGHLLFARGSDLLVVRFDPAEKRHRGEPRLVATGVFATAGGRSYFTVSQSGDLAFVLGDPAQRSLVIVDRKGRERHLARGLYVHPAFLADGDRVRAWGALGSFQDSWSFDIEHGTATRTDTVLTSPDGSQRIVAMGRGQYGLASVDSSESAVPMEGVGLPSSWSHDGQWVAFLPQNSADVGIARVDGSEPPRMLLDSPYKETWGVFSPDDRYLAYVSDESGRDEVFVVDFPDASRKRAVTNQECNQPLWWGNEIFFRCGDRAMSVEVETDPVFRVVGEPEVMFEGPYDNGETGDSHWDISPDGQHFAMVRLEEASRPRQIEVVLNWSTELKRLAPTQ